MASRSGRVNAPVATTRVRQVRQPRINHQGGRGDVVVEHEEFIADIFGSTGFVDTPYSINPGLALTFPWLSQMAPLYESYMFESLRFDFQTESATTATGTLMMAVDYDASDPPATSKQQLANYRGFVRSAPWSNCSNRSLSADLRKRSSYYVRNGPLDPNQDIKLYDVGTLNVATNGQSGNSTIGELYVRYRVRLMTPQLQNSGVGSALSSHFKALTGASALTVAGNAPVVATGTGAAATFTSTQPYQCLYSAVVNGTGMAAPTITGTATVTGLTGLINPGATVTAEEYLVNFTAPGQTFIVTNGSTTIAVGDHRFAQYNVSNS